MYSIKWKRIQNLIIRVMLIIFLVNITPIYVEKENSKDILETKAFESELEAIAPGYIITSELGGITFDLSNRLTEHMTVESFSFKNTNPQKQKNDKAETKVQNQHYKWLTTDILENGDTYEIRADIYDSNVQKTLVYINTFKFYDKNSMFNPSVDILPLSNPKYKTQDVEIDLTECKELLDYYNNFKIDILKSNLASTLFETVNLTLEQLRSKNYKIVYPRCSHYFDMKKDYIVRVSADGKMFEKIISVNVRPNPQVHLLTYGTKIGITYDVKKGVLGLDLATLGISSDYDVEAEFYNSSSNISPIKVKGKGNSKITFTIPDQYYGITEPARIDIYAKNSQGQVEFKIPIHATFPVKGKKDDAKLWVGLRIDKVINEKTGVSIKEISTEHIGFRTIPHSWDKLPKAHYITLYNSYMQNQIGGEYRYDVVRSKTEFVGKKHNVSGANFTIRYEEMKQGFNVYNFKVESSNERQDWAYAYIPFMFYSDICNISKMDIKVSNFSMSPDNKTSNFTLTPNSTVRGDEKMSIIDDSGTEHLSQSKNGKDFNFSNVPILAGGKYIVTLNNVTSLVYFNSVDSSILFNPRVVASTADGEDRVTLNISDNFKNIINKDPSKNKIRILYINGNSTGNEFSGVSSGDNDYRLIKNLINGEMYILELDNGKEILKTTFEYTPLRLNIESFTETSTTLGWVYPNNYLVSDGDSLNIYFKKDGYNYPAVPDAKIVHGFQSIDFEAVKTYTVRNLSPNINYTAKLELITNDGVKFSSEASFVTSEFQIINEGIVGLGEDGIIYDKTVDLVWDLTKPDTEFSPEDRIDIYLKLKSHDAFSRTPAYSIKEDLNRVRKATIKVDTYDESYSVKIVYNIGGVKYPSKPINFTVSLPEFKVFLSQVGETDVKIGWKYPEGTEFDKGQSISVFLKKSSDAAFGNNPNFIYVEKGNSSDGKTIKDIVSCEFNGLQEDTMYQVKVEYKIDEKHTAGVVEAVKKQGLIDFKTSKFRIKNIVVKKLPNRQIDINWIIENPKYAFSNKDQLNVYMKEKSQYDYGNPLISKTKDLNEVKNLIVTVPKYDVEYDIKITYKLNNKEVSSYASYKLKVGDISFRLSNIQDTSAEVTWVYPEDFSFIDGDIVEVYLRDIKNNSNATWDKKITKTHSNSENLSQFTTYKIDNLTKDNKYEIKFSLKPKNSAANEKMLTFKAVSGFQIYKIDYKNINSTSIELNWAFYPENHTFDPEDTLEILQVEEKRLNFFATPNSIYETKTDLQKLTSYVVKGLNVEKEYNFTVKYTFKNSQGTDSKKEVSESIKGKSDYGDFDFSIQDVGYTGIDVNVVYPEAYEIKSEDILDIYITKKDNTKYDSKPNFSAKHGSGEVKTDLNEITNFNILGLASDTEYKAKAVFWSGGGKGIKKEKEVFFQTGHIEGIEKVEVIDFEDHLVNVAINFDQNKEIIFGNNDYFQVFLKKKTDKKYPKEPNGEVYGDVFNEKHLVSAYFDELNTAYDLKVVASVGEAIYEKEIEFTGNIENINVQIKEINPMSAQLEWKYPDNYKLIDGESIKIYIKYKDDAEFSQDPSLEIIQSPENNISDVNLIEFFELIPDTEYEIKVKLNLLEVNLPEVINKFKTAPFTIKDFAIKGVTDKGLALSWSLNTDEIQFIDEYDSLAFFVKDVEEKEFNLEKPVVEYTSILDNIRSVLLPIDKNQSSVDILMSYLIEDYESNSEIQYNSVKVEVVNENESTTIKWKYPDNIKFENGDKLSIYVKDFDEIGYLEDPIFKSVHGEDDQLEDLTEISIEDMSVGKYNLKFNLICENIDFVPIEVPFEIGGGSNDIIEIKVSKASEGRSIVLSSNYNFNIDYSKGINVNPEGLKVEKIGDKKQSMFKLSNLVPGKKYDEITINATNLNNKKVNLMVTNVMIKPETLLEEFLTNIYSFAFERYPDENGYSYWLSKLLERKDITGKYVLYNLMFAEREFTDRNLPDTELIKVLYQIVVNRKYDEQGLNFWVKEYKENYLPNANNDSYAAQQEIVKRMIHEQEFKNLCEKMGILW